MSFGYSVGDFVAIVQLAHKTYRNCQKAGPEYVEIARETRSLHSVLKILRTESKSSESVIFKRGARSAAELLSTIRGCHTVLNDIDGTLAKYEGLDPGSGVGGAAGAGKKLWQKIRFGSKVDELGVIRGKLITYTSMLSVLLDTMQLKATGQLGTQIETGFVELKNDFEAMRKEVLTTIVQERAKHRYGSLLSLSSLSTYDGDNKETWVEFRRELIGKGFRSQTLDKHRDVLIAYMMKLEKSGILDKVTQASSASHPGQAPWWTKHMFVETINLMPEFEFELSEASVPKVGLTTSVGPEKARERSPSPNRAKLGTSQQQGIRLDIVDSASSLAAAKDTGSQNNIDPISEPARLGRHAIHSKWVEESTTYSINVRSPYVLPIGSAFRRPSKPVKIAANPLTTLTPTATITTTPSPLSDEASQQDSHTEDSNLSWAKYIAELSARLHAKFDRKSTAAAGAALGVQSDGDQSDQRSRPQSRDEEITHIESAKGNNKSPGGEAAAEGVFKCKQANELAILEWFVRLLSASTDKDAEAACIELKQAVEPALRGFFVREIESGNVVNGEDIDNLAQAVLTATFVVADELAADQNMSLPWHIDLEILTCLQKNSIVNGSRSTFEVQQLAKAALLAGAAEASRVCEVPEGWSRSKGKKIAAATIGASLVTSGPNRVKVISDWVAYHFALAKVERRRSIFHSRMQNDPDLTGENTLGRPNRSKGTNGNAGLAALAAAGLGVLGSKKTSGQSRSSSRNGGTTWDHFAC